MNNELFYRFRAEAGEEPASAELLIFDVIGNWEEIGEVSAKGFAKALSELPSSIKRLDIHINSPGGSVFDGSAIYSRLADHRSDKYVYVDGIAASAASIIAMVGKKIYVRANAQMMIHHPSGVAIGNASTMRKAATALDVISDSMINIYARRTKQDRERIRGWMDSEFWMTADMAVESGFADEVRGVVKAAAMIDDKRAIFNGVTFDLSRFHNIPAFTAATTKGNTMEIKPKAEETPPAGGEQKPAEGGEQKPAEGGEQKPAQGAEQKPAEQKTVEQKPAEQKPGEGAAAETEVQKAIRAERERIAALQKLDRPATHEIITKAIADGKTVADIAPDLFDAMDKAGTQQARRTDAAALGNLPASDAGSRKNSEGFGAKVKERVKAKMKTRSRVLINSRN